jgi:cbb3-type cytochrome oxidase subunit 3
MSVIPITIFFSLLLVALFVGLFWREQRARRFGGPERDSLLPLAEETPRSAHLPAPAPTAEQDDIYF